MLDEFDPLLEWLASVKGDPLAHVMGAYPWGEPGQLENESGPSQWQRKILVDIRDGLLVDQAIMIAVASGNGIGKSCLVAWIILWAFSTFPNCRGVVTANTEPQLKGKTWAELGKWFNLFIARELFRLTATALFSRDPHRQLTWRIDMVPWNENRPEGFAGLHNRGKRVILVKDEASAIPDKIWEFADPILTDTNTEIIWCVFGNPTRSIGRFRECFAGGRFSHMWRTYQIDSRTVSITNKLMIDKLIAAWGIDSDYIRIRVLGIFPKQGEMEFFVAVEIDAAFEREPISSMSDPLALGVDVARYGANESVMRFRKGRDGRTIPRQSFRGINTVELAMKIQAVHHEMSPDGVFIDGGGVGGGVVDNVRNMGIFCWDVQFGGKDDVGGSPWGIDGEKYANKRAAMYGALRGWIRVGSLESSDELRRQLLSIKYYLNQRGEIQLESKEDMMRRGDPSPDDADALALTFAYPLEPHLGAGGIHIRGRRQEAEYDYDPFAKERMEAV